MNRIDRWMREVSDDAEFRHARNAAERAAQQGEWETARELTARMDAIADAIAKRMKREVMN